MRHGKERDVESTQGYGRAVLDLAKLGALDVVLGELALDDAKGELTGVDGHLVREVLQQVRKGARVVLVAVGDDNAAQLVLVLQDIGVVGQDEVDARMVVVGKHEAGIDHDHVVSVLEHGHVLADPVKTTKRDDLEGGFFLWHCWGNPFLVVNTYGIRRYLVSGPDGRVPPAATATVRVPMAAGRTHWCSSQSIVAKT